MTYKANPTIIYTKRILKDFYLSKRYPRAQKIVLKALSKLNEEDYYHLKWKYMLNKTNTWISHHHFESERTVKYHNRQALENFIEIIGEETIEYIEFNQKDNRRYHNSQYNIK